MASLDGSCTSRPVIFYGVFVPKDKQTDENGSGVFTDKAEALAVAKKSSGARFNSFKTFQEALTFSQQTQDQLLKSCSINSSGDDINGCQSPVNNASMVEKGTSFRGPKTQEYVKLRKAIESGDAEYVIKTVWSNPRFLISSGDTPSILQEGSRYNALHVVAKSMQPTLCRMILETIEDTKFMKLLYSDDSNETTAERTAFLVDLYLNMPEKGLSETPLHFASKFGCLKIVEMLVLHPQCNKSQLNKNGQMAKEIACSRSPKTNSELKRKIENAFEDRYYVPVWDCQNHTVPPYVGEPVSPSKRNSASKMLPRGSSPVGASLVVRALAGPMSPKQADDLYKQWKTPPFTKCGALSRSCPPQLDIKLSDTEKGLERIGRQLAEEKQLQWVERWPFLGEFCNIKKPDGMGKLESFLRNKYRELMETRKQSMMSYDDEDDQPLDSFVPSAEGSHWSSFGQNSTVGRLCDSFDRLQIRSSPESKNRTATNRGRRSTLPPASFQHVPPPLEMVAPPKSVDQLPPLSPLQLATGQMLDRLCRQVARVVTQELKERARYNGGSQRDFMSKVRPGLECLLRVVRDCHQASTSEGSVLGSDTADVIFIHDTIAGFVTNALADDSAFSDDSIAVTGGGALAELAATHDCHTSSDDESSGEEDFSRWRGGSHPGVNAREAVAVKLMVQRHLACVLSRVVVRRGQCRTRMAACTCQWNLLDGNCATELAPAATGVSFSPPLIQRRTTEETRPTLLAKSKWSCPLDASTPIMCAVGRNRNPAAGFATHENGDDSSSVDSYCTPPSSYLSSESSSCGEVYTPDEGLVVFINGLQPSKYDVDVLRALENASIDPILYPHLARWKEAVTAHTKEEIASWPTPTSVRSRRVTQRPEVQNSASPLLTKLTLIKSHSDDDDVMEPRRLFNSFFSDSFN